tara:strand:+ start:997 stop:3585 length:2589 start_codon:yes stop_codon:yes gene_type:complete
MADLRYTRRTTSRGNFPNRGVGDDKEVTKSEQRIIDFIKETQKQTLAVRQDEYKGKESVMLNEKENREINHKLKVDWWRAKEKNTQIAQRREVDYYRDLAKQAGEEADFWQDYSPTFAKDIGKVIEGLGHTIQYHRDKSIDDANKKREQEEKEAYEAGREEREEYEWGPDGQPPATPKSNPWMSNNEVGWQVDGVSQPGKSFISTDRLQQNAENSLHEQALIAQKNLNDEGEYAASDEVMAQTFGRSANTKWWGTYYGRRAASTFEQDWPTIVALAEDNVDPSLHGEDLVRASYYKWLEHKGISINSIAGKEVTKKFDKKLNALSNSRTQQHLALKDEQKSTQLLEQVRVGIKNFDPDNPAELQNAFSNLMLHEARANKYIDGKFSPAATRIINYGETFDSLVEPLLKVYPWSSFDEFKEKILNLKILGTGDPNSKAYKNRATYLKQRAHKIDGFEDLYVRLRDKEVKRQRAAESDRINRTIAENKLNPKYDNTTEDGRRALWAGLNSAESEAEKAWFGEQLSYDPKSHVSQGKHEALMRALRQEDWAEYSWHLSKLTDPERKYYENYIEGVKEYQALEDAGHSAAILEDEAKTILNKNIGFTLDKHVVSHFKALEMAKQRFRDINLSYKVEEYPNPAQRLKLVREQWIKELDDKEGLWKAEEGEFVNFSGSHEYKDVRAPEIEIHKVTIEEVNNMRLLSTEAQVDIKKAIIRGDDSIPVPKIIFDIWERNPELSLTAMMNGQLKNEDIDKQYDFKFDPQSVKATQIDYLKAKAIDPYTALGRPEDIVAKSAWYDLNQITKSITGQNFIDPKVTTYMTDKLDEYKPKALDTSSIYDLQEIGDIDSLNEISNLFPIKVAPIAK